MEILATTNYPYQFIINGREPSRSQSSSFGSSKSKELSPRDEIIKWCSENCKGMWTITLPGRIIFYSPSAHESPVSGTTFEASAIYVDTAIMLCFEAEDEAMAFQLTFVGGEK